MDATRVAMRATQPRGRAFVQARHRALKVPATGSIQREMPRLFRFSALLVVALLALVLTAAATADNTEPLHGAAVAPRQQKDKDDASAVRGQDRADDPAKPDEADAGESPEPAAPASDAPVLGEQVGVTPSEGTVRVRTPDGEGWTALEAGTAVPNGTVVDARQGAITLSTAVDAAGTQQSATFSGAVFAVDQPHVAHSVTRLALRGGDFSKCTRAVNRVQPWAAISARRKPVRRLFGSGHGRFRTQGRFAAATVRGTIWVTEDYCDRTVITVKRGVVGVKDLRSGRTVDVRAGHSRTVRRR
jgi:hypothetical protein